MWLYFSLLWFHNLFDNYFLQLLLFFVVVTCYMVTVSQCGYILQFWAVILFLRIVTVSQCDFHILISQLPVLFYYFFILRQNLTYINLIYFQFTVALLAIHSFYIITFYMYLKFLNIFADFNFLNIPFDLRW